MQLLLLLAYILQYGAEIRRILNYHYHDGKRSWFRVLLILAYTQARVIPLRGKDLYTIYPHFFISIKFGVALIGGVQTILSFCMYLQQRTQG